VSPAQAPPRSVWPLPIGVLSLLVGVLMVLSAVVRFTWGFILIVPRFAMMGCVGFVVGLLLLAAGAQLLRRDPHARWLHLTYACVHLLVNGVLIGLLGRYFVFLLRVGALPLGMALSLFWAGPGSAYPVFVLAWFLRPGIREEMADWPRRDEPGPAAGASASHRTRSASPRGSE
jgi:hypothetical protein